MGHKLVLFVEDNRAEAELMRLALDQNGVTAQVKAARDGEEALNILLSADRYGNPRPSVVFLDLKLPKVSGLEVLKVVRSQDGLRMLPVVILSSSGREKDIRSAYRLGANSYVRKPVNFDEFTKAVDQLTSYWLGLNQPGLCEGVTSGTRK